MSDVWTQAAREAFATATGGVILFTLELYHPDWDAPIFVVSGFEDIVVTLEATAPRLAGQQVECIALPFEVVDGKIEAATTPEVTLKIDNVSNEMSEYLEAAAGSRYPVKAIPRTYLESNLSVPLQVLPFEMTVTNPSANNSSVTCTLTVPDVMQRNAFTESMTSARLPNL